MIYMKSLICVINTFQYILWDKYLICLYDICHYKSNNNVIKSME